MSISTLLRVPTLGTVSPVSWVVWLEIDESLNVVKDDPVDIADVRLLRSLGALLTLLSMRLSSLSKDICEEEGCFHRRLSVLELSGYESGIIDSLLE